MDHENIKTFFDMWKIYDFLLDRNYMLHKEIYADVALWLREQFESRTFSIVDLGCGNARFIAQALQNTTVSRYVGYDLSDVALRDAARHLASLKCDLELRQANFMEGMENRTERFDLIFSSYSLHHFEAPAKGRFFNLARQKLQPGGAILLIDTAREDHETRELSLKSYCDWIRATWKDVPPAALEQIYAHILSSDHPETNATMHQLAADAGFSRRRDINKHLWHRTWAFGV